MGLGNLLWGGSGDPEVRKFKLILGVLVIWAVLGFQSCNEFKYATRGETTTAQVTEVKEVRGRRMSTDIRAFFQWQDSATGETRRASADYRDPADVPVGTVEIVYLPGVDHSAMPASRRSWLWPILFIGSTLAAVGAFAYLGYSLQQPSRATPSRGNSTRRRHNL